MHGYDDLWPVSDNGVLWSVKVTALTERDKALGEGELVTTTVTGAQIQWKDGFSLKNLKGKDIKLKFELRESKLFSFSFE